MAPAAGTYHLGPDDGTLSLHTRRTGAAAKAGHDLLIDVTAWEGTLTVGAAPADVAVEVVADTASLKVREGHGGVQALGDDDKANIETTIHDEILKRDRITFRSTGAEPGADGRVTVHGDMTMLGVTAPLDIDLTLGDGGAVAGLGRRAPEPVGHEALLDPVRHAEGRRRGRGGAPGDAARRLRRAAAPRGPQSR